ncbi:phage minor capsid protein [Paenibacillus dendritiformis]|uniref:Phage minor capsid protein n=1 Tax=Paenibacillus dendritiformis C454 TaxID=1131935 RepID=H3SAB3_9BACL|nr:phage minor capsid protein [Paenibacillus dendritiformis]EHQ63916.1 phage minor capsid protein [Paenibacillus dendritiformis C454]CAH8772238.1 phage minor capsid protein [Paenibacillus dendritiformis]
MSEEKKSTYDIGRIFAEMTLNLIASLKRNLSRHKREEEKVGFRFDQWQAVKLRNLRQYRKANKRIIEDAGKDAEQLVEDVLQMSFQFGEESVEGATRQVLEKKVTGEIEFPKDMKPRKPKRPPKEQLQIPIEPLSPEPRPHAELPKAPPESDFFGVNEKKLGALQETVKKDLKKAQHGVLRKMDDVYRQVIYKAEVHMTAGAKTLDQAIDMATKEFLEKGIDCITYKNGRRATITAYAEMALRTASQRATFLGEGKKRDEWGIYTVIMSAHDNCSPWCMPYQGTVLIDDVYTSISEEQAQQLAKETGYVLLSEAMQEGAFHPNCRHTLSTYFPGITQLPPPVDEETAKRNYEAEQRQRYIERQLRRYKRLAAGSLDESNQEKFAAKVKEWTEKLREHLADHPELRRMRRREKVE